MNRWPTIPVICDFAQTSKTPHCCICEHAREHQFNDSCMVACQYNKEYDEDCGFASLIQIIDEKILT